MTPETVRLAYEPKVTSSLTPGHGQHAFHRDRHRVKYRACLAGTRGGKTLAGLWETLVWMLKNPGCTGIIAEPDYKMIKRIILPKLCQEELLDCRDLEASPLVEQYHQQDHELTLVNGSNAWLLGLEDPEKAEGPDIDWVFVDEARIVRHWGGDDGAWKILRRRLSGTGRLEAPFAPGAWIATHSPTEEQAEWFSEETDARVYRWSTRDAYEAGVIREDYWQETQRSYSDSAYEAVVEGRFALPEGLVFDEYNPERHHAEAPPADWAEHMLYGVDWGFSVPSALIAVAVRGSVAHVVDESYGPRRSEDDLVREAKALEDAWGHGRWYCGHEAADKVNRFQREGLEAEAYPASRKHTKARINHVNERFQGDELYIDPDRCLNLVDEVKNWAYKPDSDEPEDGRDHACLPGDSLVPTTEGSVPIRDVRPGDRVLTRAGWRPVVAWARTATDAELWRVELSNGRSLQATPDHPVWVEGKGFTTVDALRYGDGICPLQSLAKPGKRSSSGTANGTAATPTPTSTATGTTTRATPTKPTSIGTFGAATTAKSPTGTRSITWTGIRATTTLRTWNSWTPRSINPSMPGSVYKPSWRSMGTSRGGISSRGSPGSGIGARKASNGIASRGERSIRNAWRPAIPPYATFAGPNSRIGPSLVTLASARTPAGRGTGAKPNSTPRSSSAKNAANFSGVTSTPNGPIAGNPVSVERISESIGTADVYNLSVLGPSEFFADGVLVSNCDGLMYALHGRALDAGHGLSITGVSRR